MDRRALQGDRPLAARHHEPGRYPPLTPGHCANRPAKRRKRSGKQARNGIATYGCASIRAAPARNTTACSATTRAKCGSGGGRREPPSSRRRASPRSRPTYQPFVTCLDFVAFVPGFVIIFASCADQIHIAWRCFCWFCFDVSFFLWIIDPGPYMVSGLAMTAEFDRSELTRALWSKPVVIVAIFADAHATTVSAPLDIIGAPPVLRVTIRKLPAPLTAPSAEYCVGQFGLGSGRLRRRHIKQRQRSNSG
jgi:hypothetical protein